MGGKSVVLRVEGDGLKGIILLFWFDSSGENGVRDGELIGENVED